VGKKSRFNWRKWLDGFNLAGKGILLATREKKFWIGFVVAFLFFGTLMNLLAGGLSKFQLMGAVGFAGAMKIIWDALIGTFGVNMIFLEFLPVFLIAVMQGTLIGLIVLLWDKKRIKSGEEVISDDKNTNSANVEKAGIITGLIALGAGCPTCGTTLLTPLIGAIFSSGSLAVAGVISGLVTTAAIVIAILSLKRIGEEAYVIIINEKYMRRKAEKERV
jgi:hypothetical protein